MTDQPVLTSIEDGVATVTLNRPKLHNAFDDAMIAALTEAFGTLGTDPSVRYVVLRGAGKSFCAGGDLAWMRRMAGYSHAENLADARALAELMHVLDTLPRPTVAVVQGAAYGGGVGLVACCDIAVATMGARFCLSEVKLGLIPAAISPYVVAAMGRRAARRYFLTAEPFDAAEARRTGLIHAVADDADIEDVLAGLLDSLSKGGPTAQAAAKALIADVAHLPAEKLQDETAARIAEIRAGEEGREGVSAFLEKRRPNWIPDSD